MKLNFLVAPDFAPDSFSGWYMLSTLLQRRSGIGLHLMMPANPAEQSALLASDEVDLLYANPFDAAALVRSEGYRVFARPAHRSDEMIIATAAGSSLERVEDLRPVHRIAVTNNRDVKLIGLRLLEPADLGEEDIEWIRLDSYQSVARQVMTHQVDAGFFLADAYHALSRLTRERMKVLVESQLRDISHVLLAHPRIGDDLAIMREAVLSIGAQGEPGDGEVLEALGLPGGFEPMVEEDVEFMIDLMDTLLD